MNRPTFIRHIVAAVCVGAFLGVPLGFAFVALDRLASLVVVSTPCR